MKKGGLYVLGHIIVTTDFQDSFHEVKKQQSAWMKYIDFSRIKAFPQVAIAPTFEWGARNIVLSAGLGGMRPNIAVLGFYNLAEHRNSTPLIDLGSDPQSSGSVSRNADKDGANDVDQPQGQLPTDTMRSENAVSPMSYVNILEDFLLCLQINVAIAKGFNGLELPKPNKRDAKKKYIDLWPIRISTLFLVFFL
jgi:potassium/chloride transporter 9